MKKEVKEYYGKILKKSTDLKNNALLQIKMHTQNI